MTAESDTRTGARARRALLATVRLRNPFSVKTLPLLAHFWEIASRPRERTYSRCLAGVPLKLLHRLLQISGLDGQGEIRYRIGDLERTLRFDARNTQFSSVYFSRFARGYEPETAALIDRLVGADDVFYDVGSNWGHFALYVASRDGFRGRIFAFEPMPRSHADLVSVVQQAGLEDRIECHEVALSDTGEDGFMRVPGGDHGLATLRGRGRGGVRVSRRRLDDLDLPAPGLVKVDAEGHEGRVLGGARTTLAAHRPVVVFESSRDLATRAETMAPLRLLTDLGYSLFLPAFRVAQDGGFVALGYGPHGELGPEADLALIPFAPEERLLLDRHLNVLAYPRSRIEALERVFDREWILEP